MLHKIFKKVIFGASLLLLLTSTAYAISILPVQQGGTGWGYPGNIVNSAIIFGGDKVQLATSTNLTFATSTNTLTTRNLTITGTCVGCGGITSYDPFSHPYYGGSATTSLLTLTGGLLSTASTTLSSTIHFNALGIGGLSIDSNGLVYSSATTTFSSPLLYSAGNVTCQVASGSLAGCLSSTDWNTFNNKQTGLTFTYPLSNSASVVSLLFGTTTNNTWSGLQTFTNTGTTTFAGGLQGTYLNMTGTSATSTFANGIDLYGGTGCFSVNGTCLQTIISSASAYKQATKYATVVALSGTPTYSNGTGGVGATLTEIGFGALSVDSNTPSVGDRVLIKNESSQLTNGIYTVTIVGSGIASYQLTRATDYNSNADVFPGVASFTNSGTVNANTCWILTNTSAVTIGTTALTYDDACGAGSFTGTSPINVSGTTISLNTVPVANGGTNKTSYPANTVITSDSAGTSLVASSSPTVDFIIATTTTASRFINASTTKFSIGNVTQYPFKTPGFTIATTTGWTGTTTVIQLPSPFTAQTINSLACYTDAGTLNVDIYHTSTHLTLVNASTTQNIVGFTSNNTMTPQEKWYFTAGTPASSPTILTCTFNLSPYGY